MKRRAVFLVTLSLAVATSLPAAPVQTPPATPGSASSGRAEEDPSAAALRSAWWNQQRFIDALTLEEVQRTALDALLRDYVAVMVARRAALLEAQSAVEAALLRSPSTIAPELDALVTANADVLRALGTLRSRVFSTLTAGQRAIVADRFPSLARQTGLGAVRPQAAREGGGRRGPDSRPARRGRRQPGRP